MAIEWKRLEAPKPWRPAIPGEELVGYYLGQSVRKGTYGEYTVVLVAVLEPSGVAGTVYMVSGAALVNALDGACTQIGTLLRVQYGGLKDLGGDRKMKVFEVFAGEGTLTAEDMAELVGSYPGSSNT